MKKPNKWITISFAISLMVAGITLAESAGDSDSMGIAAIVLIIIGFAVLVLPLAFGAKPRQWQHTGSPEQVGGAMSKNLIKLGLGAAVVFVLVMMFFGVVALNKISDELDYIGRQLRSMDGELSSIESELNNLVFWVRYIEDSMR